MIKRDLEKKLKQYSKFPVVIVVGPRQSGKTTLVRETFKKHLYVNLEDPATFELITKDPKKFLRENENKHGIIFDEFQHYPELLSYIQVESDEKKRPGYFVLTGSQNFLMNQAITQSLTGRAGILTLLPLSINELYLSKNLPDVDNLMIKGCYPRIYSGKFSPQEIYPSYIRQYVERDIRQLINVENLRTFQKFMKLCAARVGQQLNLEDIAANCGINRKTADQWLSQLEASYIIFLLKPHNNNYNKRLTKSPKIFFFDTGLVCSLLNIRSAKVLSLSEFRGHLFENLIVSDFYKQYYNIAIEPPIYFWRDQNGRIEIDMIIDTGLSLIPIEIKSGETITSDFYTSLSAWCKISQTPIENGFVIYTGSSEKMKIKSILNWVQTRNFAAKIEKYINE